MKKELKRKTKDLKKEKSLSKKTKNPKKEFSLPLYDKTGEIKSEIQISKKIFSEKINPSLIAQTIRVYLANQRQGTASTKTRGEVKGSTRKIYRQKGTGRARHGSIKAPIFVGGGIVGGPKPRDYSLKLNKKQKRKAFYSALTLQYQEKNLLVFDKEFLKINLKTKEVIKILEKLNLLGKKILFIFSKLEKNNFLLSARNIEKVDFIDVYSLNTYEVLNHQKLVFFDDALEVLEKHFEK